MGLIGAALAGAAEGAGAGVAKAGDRWTERIGEEQKQAAMAAREENLARIQNTFAKERQEAGFSHDKTMEGTRQDFLRGESEKGRTHAAELQKSQQAFMQAENWLNREQQSNESSLARASQERIAQLGRENALALARMHGSVQVGEGGKLWWVGAGGEKKDLGISGPKTLSATQQAAADILRDQLKQIDKAEQDLMNQSPEQQAKFAQQRARINGQIIAVLAGDVNTAFASPKPAEVPQAAIDALKKDPKLAAQFDAKYGQDASKRYLDGPAPAAEQAAGVPLVEEPPGAQPKKQPEGLIARKQRELREQRERDEARKKEYGDALY